MEESGNLKLPYIMPSQAQKHVTHNDAIRALDALVQLSVLDRDLSTPGVAVDGDRHIVGPGADGAWSGRDGEIAAWQDGGWSFFAPRPGWLAWLADEARLLVFDGGVWAELDTDLDAVTMLGINAMANETNRLVVRGAASLFDSEAGDHRLKINKAAPADTASLIFQTGYAGRAEIGLANDDALHVKVSNDGESWTDAMRVTGEGRVLLPAVATPMQPEQAVAMRDVRERLIADRIYYVRPDGSDGNDGQSDSTEGAFATIGKAVEVVHGMIDLGPHHVTIQLADGTYEESIALLAPHVGSGTITIAGNPAAPGNTVMAGAAGVRTIVLENAAALSIRDFELRGNGQAATFVAKNACLTVRSGMSFGSAATAQLYAQDNGVIDATGAAYSIVGGSGRHLLAITGSVVNALNCTVTISGAPSFSTAFAQANRAGVVNANGSLFLGLATGKRYDVATNGVVYTSGGGANFLPGNAAGTAASGGQYV